MTVDTTTLRVWQREAFENYWKIIPDDYLVVATPGSGKTTFGLFIASSLFERGIVKKIIVVVPTDHLKKQWAMAANKFGLKLDYRFSNSSGNSGRGFQGEVLTYAQVAINPSKYAARLEMTSTLVIFDEIHHGGDNLSWGNSLRVAFEYATKRLCLTGTPFRSDSNKIPFIHYKNDSPGVYSSQADYIYGYTEALKDKVVRPVMFLAYSGTATWESDTGKVVELKLGENITKKQTAILWKNALDLEGNWIPEVLKAAHIRLLQHRKAGMSDAGGLVIAPNQEYAYGYAKILDKITGQKTMVVVSDEPDSSEKILQFSQNMDYWIVAVRMVSEGVDIPRLAVGVYATSISTELFFAQAIGRFVRSRNAKEVASIFLPSVPELLELASKIEKERNHIVGDNFINQLEDDLELEPDDKEKEERNEAEKVRFSSSATLDKLIYEGSAIGIDSAAIGEEDLNEYDLGIPGLLNKEQINELIKKKKLEKVNEKVDSPVNSANEIHTGESELKQLRKQLNNLVYLENQRTGKPHGIIHLELRNKLGGPPTALADEAQLKARIKELKKLKS